MADLSITHSIGMDNFPTSSKSDCVGISGRFQSDYAKSDPASRWPRGSSDAAWGKTKVPPGGTLVAVKLAPTAILGTRGWLNAASRSGNPAIWLSEPCPDRSPLQLHPPMGGHAYGVRRLRQGLLDKTNTASGCGPIPPTDRRANETFLNRNGFVSHIHRNKPKGRAMHETMRRAYNSRIRKSARVSSMCSPSAKGSDGAIHQSYRDRPSND